MKEYWSEEAFVIGALVAVIALYVLWKMIQW